MRQLQPHCHHHDDSDDTYKALAQLAGTRIILPTARLFLQLGKWPSDSNIIIATTIFAIDVIIIDMITDWNSFELQRICLDSILC